MSPTVIELNAFLALWGPVWALTVALVLAVEGRRALRALTHRG